MSPSGYRLPRSVVLPNRNSLHKHVSRTGGHRASHTCTTGLTPEGVRTNGSRRTRLVAWSSAVNPSSSSPVKEQSNKQEDVKNPGRKFVISTTTTKISDKSCAIPTTTERDFEQEMRGFPQGVLFARGDGSVDNSSNTTDDYNREMQARMQSNICYIHEAGLNYSHVLPALIVGSCPQSPDDVEYLRSLGVTRILNLQQPADWEKFGINFDANVAKCRELGDIEIVRVPMEDFSSESLEANIPHAGQVLHDLMEDGHYVYVHCTAGLGRAPAVAIAYLHWMCGMSLTDAYAFVTARRPCHPKAAAIRNATLKLSLGDKDCVSFSWTGAANNVTVCGTFNDWQPSGVELDRYTDDFHLSEVCLPVGVHMYKYVVDDEWSVSEKEPTLRCSDGNLNNVVLVRGATGGGRAPDLLEKDPPTKHWASPYR